jgi:hypothetical protein
MNIAVDFDDTYTRDPAMWNDFILLAKSFGHTVYCVTARAHSQDEQVLGSIGRVVGADHCYFTAMQGKRAYMWANKIKIDVWIDDMPDMIVNGIEHVNDGQIILP